jgi:hypothetical protein
VSIKVQSDTQQHCSFQDELIKENAGLKEEIQRLKALQRREIEELRNTKDD